MSMNDVRPFVDEPEYQFLCEKLAPFYSTEKTTRDALIQSANASDVFRLEKRIVPQLNQDVAESLECNTLISTVGMRKEPVILTALCLRPRKLLLLHTDASRKTAEAIRDDSDLTLMQGKGKMQVVLRRISETDAPQNYDVVQEEFFGEEGPGHVVIDPTGGYKIMGISVSAMAFWYRLPMVYLKGIEKLGVVIPFSEVLSTVMNPYEHFGDRDLELLQKLFNNRNYTASIAVCRQLIQTVQDPSMDSMLDHLLTFLEIYRDWDQFQHSSSNDGEIENEKKRKLATRFRDLQKDIQRFRFYFADPKAINSNIAFLSTMEDSWHPGRNLVDDHRLVDIFLNAERRAEAGQYDDAVARLYRCIEMIASLRLSSRWGVERTDQPKLDQIVAHFQDKESFETQYFQAYGMEIKIPWGLDRQMRVLALVEPAFSPSRIYLAMAKEVEKGKTGLMAKRNRSILAHGTTPVNQGDYEEFHTKVVVMLRKTLGSETLKRLETNGAHPKLEIRRRV